jgi:hypothetical protein
LLLWKESGWTDDDEVWEERVGRELESDCDEAEAEDEADAERVGKPGR